MQGHLSTAGHSAHRPAVWIVAFGPVGAGSDGYLIRVETNARALAALGYSVKVLEIAKRAEPTTPWPNVETWPCWPSIVRVQRILGPVDWMANLRNQLALAVGLFRNWRAIRSSEAVVVEGGLLVLAFSLRLFRRRHAPLFVFDLITLMSLLHRDPTAVCTFTCKLRRTIWRALEITCVRSSDMAVAGSVEDAHRLHGGRAKVVPHIAPAESMNADFQEDPRLVGFLGNGHVVPNRDALVFITTNVLNHPALQSVRCRVIGDPEGYKDRANKRLELVGFHKDPSTALSAVSVCCAPMEGAGGVSTKVLTYLMAGKRTVSTSEAAHGIALPPEGLWIAERDQFAEVVAAALRSSWSATQSRGLRDWMAAHHGLPVLSRAWDQALGSVTRTAETAQRV